MYTQCPSCQTYFHLTPEQLRAAGGQVQCGVCETTFNALETIQEALPQQNPDGVGESTVTGTRTGGAKTAADASDKGTEKKEPRHAARSEKKAARTDRKARKSESAPPGVVAILGWFLANLVLIALFPVQFLYFERDMLASEYPELRPHLEQACDVVGCAVAPRRDPDAIEISRRDVRAHPEVDDALLIHAQLVNRADFAQPYPTLRLTLSDLRERSMAQRRFDPDEYLAEEHDPAGRMSPGDSATVVLAVQDPGDEAVNFRFKLE
ncbi:MAG: DUF3426 domain-containing protein [Pseudomonadota bacterium]